MSSGFAAHLTSVARGECVPASDAPGVSADDWALLAAVAARCDNAGALAQAVHHLGGASGLGHHAFFVVRLAWVNKARRVIGWFEAHAPALLARHWPPPQRQAQETGGLKKEARLSVLKT